MTPHLHRGAVAALVATVALATACSTGPGTPAASPAPGVSASTTAATASVTKTGPPSVPVFVTPPAVATGTGGRPRGASPAAVDRTDASAVAGAFTVDTFTVDTATDRSRFDAQVRSARWATPAYAAALTAPVPSTGDAAFTELAGHRGFTTVALAPNTDDGRPIDELRAAARSFTVTPTGHGDDGASVAWARRTIYVFLTRDGSDTPWQVDRTQLGNTTAAGQ